MQRLSSYVTELQGAATRSTTDEADFKAAGEIRAKEASDFTALEKELTEIIDTLKCAIGLLERHASMLELKNANSVAQALSVLFQASTLSSADANRLTALIQDTKSAETDGEDSLGAPAASVYEGHGGGIVDTLNGLLDRAEAQLDDARKTETADLHNYQMLKQSLVDEVKYANKEMAEAKAAIAESGEKKAIAEGDLDVTTKELNSDHNT